MKSKIRFTSFVIGFLIMFVTVAATPILATALDLPVAEKIESWADSYPKAATELGIWVNDYRGAARKLFRWDSNHPDKSKIFVIWINTHQGRGVDVFLSEHKEWKGFNR